MSHKPLHVSLELQEIFENDEVFLDEPGEDWIDKFCADAELARLGVNPIGLEKETAPTDRTVAAAYKKIAERAQRPTDLEKSSDVLAKNYVSPEDRICLREYLKKSFAEGETLEGIVAYARAGGGPATANLLQKIGEELLG